MDPFKKSTYQLQKIPMINSQFERTSNCDLEDLWTKLLFSLITSSFHRNSKRYRTTDELLVFLLVKTLVTFHDNN